MGIEELRRELAGTYRQGDERAAFIVAQVEADGYCPFTLAGRQYAATALLRRPGYVIQDVDEEGK